MIWSRNHHVLVALATALALSAFCAATAAEGTFIGSFQVKVAERDALIERLRAHGFKGVFVPENAAPDTLLYRGSKADYEAAFDLVAKLRTEIKQDLRPPQAKQGPAANDEEALGRLGLSPLQKELCDEVMKECARRLVEFKNNQRPTPELVRKGSEFNAWKMATLRGILTRDQYAGYFKAFEHEAPADDLGPAPVLKPLDPKAEKTDNAIFPRLGLSKKQEEYLDQHRAWVKKASDDLKKLAGGHLEAGAKINEKWRAGLDRILTKDQMKQYLDYWGPPPALLR